MAKKILVLLAEGFEEIEAVTIIDVLRRAELYVTIAGVGALEVKGAHGISVKADTTLQDIRGEYDAVILPGGMPGSENLSTSKEVTKLLEKMNRSGKIIGAICAAPAMALSPHGLLKGKKATCYPGFEKRFGTDTTFSKDRVVCDGNIITSRGPGSALEFSLALVGALVDTKTVQTLSEEMLVNK